jgi:hypothetical protein
MSITFGDFCFLPKVQNGAKNSGFGGVIGDFFETIKNSHQIDFISLICSALHNFSLGLFP